ncbi:hypothetical protein AGIG_G19028 [Arapaima gigas]
MQTSEVVWIPTQDRCTAEPRGPESVQNPGPESGYRNPLQFMVNMEDNLQDLVDLTAIHLTSPVALALLSPLRHHGFRRRTHLLARPPPPCRVQPCICFLIILQYNLNELEKQGHLKLHEWLQMTPGKAATTVAPVDRKKARLGLSTIDLTVTHSEGHRDVCAVEDRRRSANSQDDIWEDDSDRKPLAG